MPHLARLALALLVSTLAACGGKSSASPDDDRTGGTSAGGTSAGGTSAGGTGNGRGGTGAGGNGQAGSAGTGSGGADACTRFDDDFAGAVNVAISNQTAATIYLGQDTVTCGVSPLFQVADASGAVLPDLGDCRSACGTLRKEGAAGCPAFCAFPTTVALQPMETMYTTWDTLFRVQNELPAACVPFDAGADTTVSCDQAKRVEPGTFSFSARAGSAVDCSQTSGTGTCSACSPSPDAGCSIPGSLISGPLHTAQATVLLDERYGVYPTPSANTGPNAGDAELPAPGGAVAVLTVELIFKD